jgi:hypothetical protein
MVSGKLATNENQLPSRSKRLQKWEERDRYHREVEKEDHSRTGQSGITPEHYCSLKQSPWEVEIAQLAGMNEPLVVDKNDRKAEPKDKRLRWKQTAKGLNSLCV